MTNDSSQHEGAPRPSARCTVGARLACRTCGTVVVVLDANDADARLVCCGQQMHVAKPIRCGAGAQRTRRPAGMCAGQLYRDPSSGLLLRCIQGGSGSITVDGRMIRGGCKQPMPD